MTTLTAAGQATPPVTVLRRESADFTVSTSAGFDGVAWLQEQLDDGTWRNRHEVEPGDSGTVNGPAIVRVWVESMELGDDLTATIESNDDELWAIRRADGRVVVAIMSRSGLVGLGAGGTGAVSTVNSKTPTEGNVELSAADVGADPTGTAQQKKLEAVEEAQARIDLHKAETTPHGITAQRLGVGAFKDLTPDTLPVSADTQTAIDAAAAGKLDKGVSDGVIRGVQNGALVAIPSGGSGNTTLKITESDYAALATKDPEIIYVVVADPPPTNRLTNGDFANGQTGWTAVTGTEATFSGALSLNSTVNHTVAQYVADMANPPAAGDTIDLTFDLTYTSGSLIPRVRYTDGTYGVVGPTITSGGTKTASLTLDATKTLERLEFRMTNSPNMVIDNVVLL
jgi:hypothetical protein